ncbi:hypothetical protein F2Q70_00008777 [Brassica cretica]|uniref:Uncharacterized protein n=1 Tax=Brassica cretica TaxID=69181 RepID=A0A8S9M4Y4_BRACR|nr:hypothetical protein F2Q70_00008777 [Brassica cretica]
MRRFLSKLTPRQMGFTNFNSFLVGSSSVPRNITTTINAAQVDQTNLKAQFRLPIAYHGRASSIVISGTDIIRSRLG